MTIESEMETELSDCVHTNVLLLQQLLAQAEEWHMTLTANISELENRCGSNSSCSHDRLASPLT